jgi:hypothetical protein
LKPIRENLKVIVRQCLEAVPEARKLKLGKRLRLRLMLGPRLRLKLRRKLGKKLKLRLRLRLGLGMRLMHRWSRCGMGHWPRSRHSTRPVPSHWKLVRKFAQYMWSPQLRPILSLFPRFLPRLIVLQ